MAIYCLQAHISTIDPATLTRRGHNVPAMFVAADDDAAVAKMRTDILSVHQAADLDWIEVMAVSRGEIRFYDGQRDAWAS